VTDQQRNWDKEMADIDRVIQEQGSGVAGGPVAAPGPRPGAPPSSPAPARRGSVAITWLWVVLAVALAVALPLWPYQRTCGLQTIFFLGATGITAIVGGLAAASSWVNRRGLAHVVSLLVIAWAAAVAASEVLPRVGYARETRTWTCAATPVPAGAAAQPQGGSPQPGGGQPTPSAAPSTQQAPAPSPVEP
jgi:hypothetical protein